MPLAASFALNWNDEGLASVLAGTFPPLYTNPTNYDFMKAEDPEDIELGKNECCLPKKRWANVTELKDWIVDLIDSIPNVSVYQNLVSVEALEKSTAGNQISSTKVKFNTIKLLMTRWAELRSLAPFLQTCFHSITI